MCPGLLEEQAVRPMHVYSPWALVPSGLEQVLLFPVPLHPPGSHLDVTIFEKLNCEAELGAFSKLPQYHMNACVLVLTLCSHWLAWTLYRLQVPQWMQQNGWMRGKAICAMGSFPWCKETLFYSMASSTSVGMLSTEGQKELQCLLFRTQQEVS